MATKHLLLGRLRRDTMILDADEDIERLQENGKRAVLEGRAQEVWIIACEGYFSAADVNWQGTDSFSVTTRVAPSSVPALNPHHGEQESLDVSDQPATSVRENVAQAARDQSDSGELVDTGWADTLHAQTRAASTGAPAVQADENGKAPAPISDLRASGLAPPSAESNPNTAQASAASDKAAPAAPAKAPEPEAKPPAAKS